MKFIPLAACLFLVACNSSDKLPFTDISINGVSFSGDGCSADSGSYVLAPDKKTISILFEEYIAEVGIGSGGDSADLTSSRVTCNIAVSLDIPTGYRALLINADYRGAVFLANSQAKAKFKREYFFAGGESPILIDDWNGEADVDFTIPDRLEEYGGHLSECGEDVILRSNTSLSLSTPRNSDTSTIQVDSLALDSTAQFDYHLDYVACN